MKAMLYTRTGWPDEVLSTLKLFKDRHLEPLIQNDCIMLGYRVVVPTGLQ